MADLPVMLRVSGRRCVVVGGGPVAARRAGALQAAGAEVTVVAPEVGPELKDLAVAVHERRYEEGDLRGAMLVVVATDDGDLNARITEQAKAEGCLVNRADDPEAGDVTIPAHAQHGPVTLAVHTGGISATAAAAIRRELSAHLGPYWPALLEIAAPYRPRIQAVCHDHEQRQRRLARLADAHAMRTYKTHGRDALIRLYDTLTTPDADS